MLAVSGTLGSVINGYLSDYSWETLMAPMKHNLFVFPLAHTLIQAVILFYKRHFEKAIIHDLIGFQTKAHFFIDHGLIAMLLLTFGRTKTPFQII